MNARTMKPAAVKAAVAKSAAAQPGPDALAKEAAVSAPPALPAAAPAKKAGAPKTAPKSGSRPASAAKPAAGVDAAKAASAAEKRAPSAPAVPPSKAKAKKPKLVRDSFTMPESEYALLGEIKSACLNAGFEAKKSQLLRVGVRLLKAMDTESLRREIVALTPLKLGRPKKARSAAAMPKT